VSTGLVPLAILMWLVTYPSRAIGLLNPRIERLPRPVLRYLQLVGPAVLAALAAVNTVIVLDGDDRPAIAASVTWLAVAACLALVAWRKSLLPGLVAAVAIALAGRAAGLP
jgi:branched-subunit amino acid transport protein